MTYSIRPYRDGDADDLARLCLEAIRVTGSRAYSDEQTVAWAAKHGGAEMYLRRVSSGHVVFVATDEQDRPVAYALIEQDGHLDRLYCHPDHSGKGLAVKLLQRAEEFARSKGFTRLYTEASELARNAFEKAGYTVTHTRNFAISHDGKDVPIHNYAMEKPLS